MSVEPGDTMSDGKMMEVAYLHGRIKELEAENAGLRTHIKEQAEDREQISQWHHDALIKAQTLETALNNVLNQDRKRGYPTGMEWSDMIAAHITAFHPQQAIALLDQIAELRGALEGFSKHCIKPHCGCFACVVLEKWK